MNASTEALFLHFCEISAFSCFQFVTCSQCEPQLIKRASNNIFNLE